MEELGIVNSTIHLQEKLYSKDENFSCLQHQYKRDVWVVSRLNINADLILYFAIFWWYTLMGLK